MSSSKPKGHQLSLIAQFDDLSRMMESLLSSDGDLDNQIKILLHNCDKQRLHSIIEHNELNELKIKFSKLMEKNKSLETTLKNVREAFKKELSSREKIQAERDLLINKLNQVKNYLISEEDPSKDSRTSLKETILSSLNLHKLTTVIEENSNSEKSASLSGVEFDKSEEDVLDDKCYVVKDLEQKKNLDDIKITDQQIEENDIFENEDQFDDFSILNDTICFQFKNTETQIQKNTPATKSRMSINSRRSALSETLMKQHQSNQPEELNVDNRPHQFVTKKQYKTEKCGPCGQSITFLSTCYHCRDCRAICHMGCKDKVPLPCIPYVSRANIGKQGKLILISDFVPLNCRPCVPALIVHCTNEIEKRGLKQVGLYRVSGPEKEVRDLKEKILKSKHGIPQLSNVDVHVLCNVIKKFLCQLDEALIIRIAWRDFVAVLNSDLNLEERSLRFKDAILSLPNANRDTLAYLMLHLRRISVHIENKMDISNLSKIFGPTVLGYSIRDPPQERLIEENKKQHQIVECLLNLDDQFWQSILELDKNNHLNSSKQVSPGNMSLLMNYASPDQHHPKSRPSIGSRLCGGKVNSGMITPLKNKKTKKNIEFKPLF